MKIHVGPFQVAQSKLHLENSAVDLPLLANVAKSHMIHGMNGGLQRHFGAALRFMILTTVLASKENALQPVFICN